VAGALLESKLRVPARRAGTVPRPRLTARLASASRSPFTLVSASAGFGKTTLLTEWLASLPAGGAAVAWLSLDARDNDPTRFWTYVVAALQQADAGAGDGARSLLETRPADETVLTELLQDLDGLTRDLLLVLDDYHLLDTTEIHDGMAFLLDHLPPRLHLVVASRSDPSLGLSRLRVRGDLVEVRAADLRFTPEEAVAYLNGAMGLSLTEQDVEALDGRTEGWIAALQLAALSMQGRDDVSGFIAGFTGDDRYVVDYLVDEVLSRQPSDVRDFLLRTSVLERLTGPLCDAVTGQGGGKAMLTALDRANLFLVPLDDRREWYRYHHLFAEVLHAHLVDEHGTEVAELHRRAGGWLADHDHRLEAVEHAVAGHDFARAAELMELAAPEVARNRHEATLRSWARLLPDDVVRVRPVLGVAFAGGLAQVSEFDGVAARLDAVEALLRPRTGTGPAPAWPDVPPPGVVVADVDGFHRLPANVAMYRAALALASGDVGATVEHARESQELALADDHLARAASAALEGLALWSVGDLAGAYRGYTEAVAGLKRAGHVADVLGCTITLADLRTTQGRLDAALAACEQALELAAADPGAPLRGTGDMHVGIAAVLLERGDVSGAEEHLAASLQLGDSRSLPQNPYRSRVVTARLRVLQGDLDAALELLDEADRVYNGDYSPNVRPVPAVRTRLRIRRGELARAAAWAEERGVTATDELSYLREYEHVTLARLLLAQHDAGTAGTLEQATSLIGRLLEEAHRGGRTGTSIELLVLLARAQSASGDTEAATETLRRAITLAEPQDYLRVFADEGQPVAALLARVAKRPAASPYVRRLLAAAGGTAAAPAATTTSPSLVEPLSARELDVLRLLDTDLDGPDIARQLSVSVNTLRTHTKNIYLKLGVSSRRAAVRQAQELDLLPRRRHG
jgi:LuxR family maltose regulon positive regulatory protein